MSRSPYISPLVPAVFLNLQVLYYGLELLVFLKCRLRESVTPGFKDKTECIAICMPGSISYI